MRIKTTEDRDRLWEANVTIVARSLGNNFIGLTVSVEVVKNLRMDCSPESSSEKYLMGRVVM
jgi:hypothetical protein